MFESALGRSEAAYDRLGTGAILSAGVHALVAALVFIVPGKTKLTKDNAPDLAIVHFVEPKIEAPGGNSGPASTAPKQVAPAPPKPDKVPIVDKPPPKEQVEEPVEPKDTPPANTDGQTGAESDAPANPGGGSGEGGGTGSGSGSGNGTGTGNGTGSEEKSTYTELNWNAEMERPVLVAGPAQPVYPREAMQLRREATVVAKCRIALDGAVRDCRILKGEAFFDEAALGALTQQRYRPLMYGGRPVSVWYVFRFQFKLK